MGSFKADDKAEARSARAMSKESSHTREPAQPDYAADLHIDREAGKSADTDKQMEMPKKGMRSSGAASSGKSGEAKPKQAGKKNAGDGPLEALRPRQDGSFMGSGDSTRPRDQPSGLRLTTRTKNPPAQSRLLQPKQDTKSAYADALRPEENDAVSGQPQDAVSEGFMHSWKLPGRGEQGAQPAAKPAASGARAAQDGRAAQGMPEKGAKSGLSKDRVFEGSARAWDSALTDGAWDVDGNKLDTIVSQADGNQPVSFFCCSHTATRGLCPARC